MSIWGDVMIILIEIKTSQEFANTSMAWHLAYLKGFWALILLKILCLRYRRFSLLAQYPNFDGLRRKRYFHFIINFSVSKQCQKDSTSRTFPLRRLARLPVSRAQRKASTEAVMRNRSPHSLIHLMESSSWTSTMNNYSMINEAFSLIPSNISVLIFMIRASQNFLWTSWSKMERLSSLSSGEEI